MNKATLFTAIIESTKADIQHLEYAANQAKQGATHEQSKAETQYDTLGLENAFLASGQSKRASELKAELQSFIAMTERLTGKELPHSLIGIGSLVEYEILDNGVNRSGDRHWVLLADSLGGTSVSFTPSTNIADKSHTANVKVTTTKTPIGQSLNNAEQDDEVDLMLANGRKTIHILSVY